MFKYSRALAMTTVASSIFFAAPALAQTTATKVSGSGTIGTLIVAPAGTQANPWTLAETITANTPLVISLNNLFTNPVGPSSTVSGFTYGKWITLTVTNSTGATWSSFDLELQSVLGTASTNGDGLSFAQGSNLPFSSNKYSNLNRTEDVRDFLNFNGGSVLNGQSVTFTFAITDNTARSTFYLSQTPNRVIGGVPEPTTWAMMVLGFGAMGGAIRRRPKTTMRIRFA